MPRNVTATLFTTIKMRSSCNVSLRMGTKASAMSVIEPITFEVRYQPRRLNVVSGNGAQKNLNVCGRVLIATRPAMAASPSPCCFAR